MKLSWQFKSLRQRLIVTFLSLILISIVILSAAATYQVTFQTKDDFQRSIDQQLLLVDQSMALYTQNISANTRALSELPLIKLADSRITSYVGKSGLNGFVDMDPTQGDPYEQAVFQVLKTFQSAHPSLKNAGLGVQSNGGFIKYPPSKRFDGYDARERDWYKKAMEQPGEVVISEIYTTSSNEKVVLCVTTVQNAKNEIVGVITVDFDLKDLSDTISKVKIGDAGFIILTDSTQRILAHPKDPSAIGKTLMESKIRMPLNKMRYQSKPSALQAFPLTYVVVVPEKEFYKSAWLVINRMFFIVILLVGLALMASILLSNRLSHPLLVLSQFSDTLAAGNLSERLEMTRRDEIGQLCLRFNHMAGALQESTEHLEERVQERTIKLSEANHNLITTNLELERTLEILKNTQLQLIQSEKLAGLGSMVSGIAHEINTPLGSAITLASYVETLNHEIKKTWINGQMQKRDFENFIETSAQAIDSLNRNLDRSRYLVDLFKQVAVDQSSEIKRVFHVKSYIDDFIETLKVRLSQSGLSIYWNCSESIEIENYPGALLQIITQLIENAIAHGFSDRQGGQINLSFTVSQMTGILIFSDDGKGIEKSMLNRIFDPFFTTAYNRGATGLGLHIVYNIVTLQLNGTIEVTSTLGKGVVFTITFPIK